MDNTLLKQETEPVFRKASRLIWLSDIHLEFVSPTEAGLLIQRIFAQQLLDNPAGVATVGKPPDAVLITGDISNACLIEYHLGLLAEKLPCPIYFVLGNHDFYKGSFAQVDALVKTVCARNPNLIELGHDEIIPLGTDCMLMGHRGWADGRAGLASQTRIRVNDHQYITDLREPSTPRLFEQLNRLGDESADYIHRVAPKALAQAKNLIIATHVPPFVEAALYENKPSEPAFAPHFVNVAMGRAIMKLAQDHPDKNIQVLCGHTHHRATYSPLSNLKIEVAGAEYRYPQIAAALTFP